ncbi:MAG: RNA polymerase sigma factor (sigma-70 family) [Saprospiraceae bacterium]|jgi:RNA polymerase sigma factor (sigma-70 family)
MNSTQQTDIVLWDQLRLGDREAFQTIYQKEIQYLFNYGRKLFQDEVRVQDAIHDLFVELWDRREGLGKTDHIRKYLTVAIRRKLVHIVKKDRKYEGDMEGQTMKFEAELSIEDLIIKQECSSEQSSKLQEAYKSLTSRQREVLFLKYHQGMEYEQIAEVVGIRYQSLRNVLSGAIRGLRVAMASMLILLIISCSEEVDSILEIDAAIAPIIEAFEEEAANRGRIINITEERIGAVFDETTDNAAGQCVAKSNGEHYIRIDAEYWKNASGLQREFLVFHELGHCVLGRSHEDGKVSGGQCMSMMTSGVGGCDINYSTQTRVAYIDELFSN